MFISSDFEPLDGLVGGFLIGGVCAARLAGRGRLSGMSKNDIFMPGVAIGGIIVGAAQLASFDELNTADTGFPLLARLIIAGLLVGTGVAVGQGCTCGNGVQGLGSLWPSQTDDGNFLGLASLLNVCCFMGAAAVTAISTGATDAVLPQNGSSTDVSDAAQKKVAMACFALVGIVSQWPLRKRSDPDFSETLNQILPLLGDILAGIAFAFALAISGMSKPSKVLGFVEPTRSEGWDPTLALVMGGALMVSFPSINGGDLVAKAEPQVFTWASRPVQLRHALGGILFGAGWGLGGVCPMPGLLNAGATLAGLNPLYAAFTGTMLGSFVLAMVLEGVLCVDQEEEEEEEEEFAQE